MFKIIIAVLALMTPESKPAEVIVGKGSTFYPIEKGMNNGILGCTGAEWKNPDQPYCASRDVPCGKWVHIENLRTGDAAWCKVMDRGPYGKYDEEGEWFNAARDRKEAEKVGRPPRNGTYRSVIDMSRSVSKKINSKGMAKVKVRWWKKNPLRSKLEKKIIK